MADEIQVEVIYFPAPSSSSNNPQALYLLSDVEIQLRTMNA